MTDARGAADLYGDWRTPELFHANSDRSICAWPGEIVSGIPAVADGELSDVAWFSPAEHARLPRRARREFNGGVNEELRRELLARRDDDQQIRTLVPRGRGQYTNLPAEMAAQWQRIDEDNTRWLADVVRGRGWPGRTMVGEDGAAAAWLLAQHADRDLARQRTFLDALRGAVDNGEASPSHLAYLEDRVRVNAGHPQLYGTQFIETDSELRPHPIEDPHRLDKRRAEAGLEPFADYEARMRAQS